MNPTDSAPAPRRSPLLPKDQDERAALATRVAAAWQANPQLTLLWKTQAAFAQEAAQYAASLTAKTDAATQRPALTDGLGALDLKITAGLGFVKDYLAEKFGRDQAVAYYPQFGIVQEGRNYQLPTAQTERAKALIQLVNGLATHGLHDRAYGAAYWQPLRDGYAATVTGAQANAQQVGALTGAKNALADEVSAVLSALLCILEGNYRDPAARQAKQRELGFLREYSG